jgi:hypothetical protein
MTWRRFTCTVSMLTSVISRWAVELRDLYCYDVRRQVAKGLRELRGEKERSWEKIYTTIIAINLLLYLSIQHTHYKEKHRSLTNR